MNVESSYIVRVNTGIGEQYAHLSVPSSVLYVKGQLLGDALESQVVNGPYQDAESAWAAFWAGRRSF